MKNTVEGMNSKPGDIEEHIRNLGDRIMEIPPSEKKKNKKKKKIFKKCNQLKESLRPSSVPAFTLW